jgi:hypothetical protein
MADFKHDDLTAYEGLWHQRWSLPTESVEDRIKRRLKDNHKCLDREGIVVFKQLIVESAEWRRK